MIQDKIFFDEKDPTGVSYNTPFTVYGSYQGRLWSKTPSGTIKYYTQNSDLSVYATTGSNQFSGSQTVTGSLTVTGGITGSVTTASYVEYNGVANKPALVSGSAQIVGYNVFATTGSNQFNGSQAITGSLTVTGQVIAQTLNVQQVTSSIVYSSGSNVFGNSLANTQQFTGSVSVTGSLAVAGAGTNSGIRVGSTDGGRVFIRQSAGGDAEIGAITNGGLFLYANNTLGLSFTGAAATFASTVTALGGYLYGQTVNSFVRLDNSIGSQIGYLNYADVTFDSDGFKFFTGTGTSGSRAQKLVFNSTGNVGIGSNSPNEKLEVQDGYISTYHNANINDAGYGIQFYTNGGGSKNSLAYIGLSQVGTARSGNLLFQTSNAGAPSTKMTITSDGKVGIGAPSPSSLLEVAGGGIFSLQLSGNLTNATRKFAFIQGKHYTNSEEPIAMIGIDSQASTSILYIGGGLSSELNAATEISFQTGATNTTLTGTERLRIASGGLVTVTGTGAGATSEGVFFKRTSNLAQGGYISGNGGVFNIVATDEQNSNNGNIYFQRYNGTTVSNSMVINSNGVVLINNTLASPNGVLNTFKTPVNSTYVDQIVVQGTGNYPSLRLGTYDAYDGVIATTGNDLRILAGLDVYTENHSIRFYTSFIGGTGGAQAYERMRIESDGVVQVRSGNELRAYRPDNARYGTFYTDNNTVVIAASVDPITLSSPERIVFSTAGTERMRITSGGYLKVSSNGVYIDSSGPYHEIVASANNTDLLFMRHTAASPYGAEIQFSAASPNNSSNWFAYYYDSTNVKFIVYSNGNVVNRNGSYGTISDIKYKENIVDATPKLDDILKLQVRNFNLIGDNKKQIGFIAQEFEEVFPSMVDISIDKNTEEEYKSIKTTVLIPMLVKAIQELKSENDILKSILQRNNIS